MQFSFALMRNSLLYQDILAADRGQSDLVSGQFLLITFCKSKPDWLWACLEVIIIILLSVSVDNDLH